MESLLTKPEWATRFSMHELAEKTGAQQLPHSDFQHGHRIANAGKAGLTKPVPAPLFGQAVDCGSLA
jgi:hypothetical protein